MKIYACTKYINPIYIRNPVNCEQYNLGIKHLKYHEKEHHLYTEKITPRKIKM